VAPTDAPHAAKTVRAVIVGAGIAGMSAAETLRQASPDSPITLIATDPEPPYYRLNLTRYLAGEIDRASLQMHPDPWFAERRIELLRNAEVARLLPDDAAVLLADGRRLPYEALILALGAHPFLPSLDGNTLDGVFTLRTAADADEILRRIRDGARCVCVGGGVLGIETAGALARQGADVTLLESHGWLMPRQLNEAAAAVLERHIGTVGVKVRKHARTQKIVGKGRVEGVLLQDGVSLTADLVLFATGVRPNTALARRAGLPVDQGIIVDAHLSVGIPGVFAAGDVAEFNGQTYGSWAASQYQGSIAALNAVGVPTQFGGLPRANTVKALGLDITSVGLFAPEDGGDLVVESGNAVHHVLFLFRDGRIKGAIIVGRPGLAAAAKQAVESGRDFSVLMSRGLPSCDDIVAHLQNA
jgi:nitrite reductase (NADH) large subunit